MVTRTRGRARRLTAAGLLAAATAMTGIAAGTPAGAAGQDAAGTPGSGVTPVAGDAQPCGPAWMHPDGLDVQNCPDWAPDGKIPVYLRSDPYTEIVGYIDPAGDDWYYCQEQGAQFVLGNASNSWWANTKADNGEWGMVPQVYFKGGGNHEPDGGLKYCK